MEQAKLDGYKAISLSVDPRNPSTRHYERFGFIKCGVSGTSWIMKLNLLKYKHTTSDIST